MYTIRMFITFFKEFTRQSNTAFNFGTRLIVFNGLKTRSTRSDLIVERLAPAAPPPPLQSEVSKIKRFTLPTHLHKIESHGHQGTNDYDGVHDVPELSQVGTGM